MEPFRNWGCNFCGAHGPCSSDEEGWRLAQEHARGCAGYLRNERDTDVRGAAPEMLDLLRDIAADHATFNGADMGGDTGRRLAALLARFPR